MHKTRKPKKNKYVSLVFSVLTPAFFLAFFGLLEGGTGASRRTFHSPNVHTPHMWVARVEGPGEVVSFDFLVRGSPK